MAKITNEQAVLGYLKGRDWTSPTELGRVIWGPGRHSSSASPTCLRLTKEGKLERNARGHYRLPQESQTVAIVLHVPLRSDLPIPEIVAKIGDALEQGMTESCGFDPTVAEQIGCEGNTIAMSVDGVIHHEICL